MAVVQSAQQLQSVRRAQSSLIDNTISLFNGASTTYELIYQHQPELRSAVDFLARNISQLPIHAFDRVSDVERRRITDSPLAATLKQPDPRSTRSAWLDAFVKDLAIFDAAFFVKIKADNGRIALVRIPPPTVELLGGNWLRPDAFLVRGTNGNIEFSADQVLYTHGYNPSDPRSGLSPIETLRQLLAEQAAAGDYRERFWRNSARMGGIIERPAAAPNWSDAARARFRSDFDASYTGAGASGKTLVLEEGMTYKPVSYSARDAQYLESFQLSREIVAATYGIPVGLLGLGQTTYASLSEQHRQLYADCLAPWLTRIQEELEAQLLSEFDTPDTTYLEFALQAKLNGSFTEQAAVLQASVGAPYLSRNEARARLNLPPIDGGDELVTPLNVLIGGQASPQDSVPDSRLLTGAQSAQPAEAKTAQPDDAKALRRSRVLAERRAAAGEFETILVASFERQRRSVSAKLGAKQKSAQKADVGDVFNRERFDAELAADLRPAMKKAARKMAATVGPWDPENAASYFDTTAENFAVSINDATEARLAAALSAEDPDAETANLFDSLGKAMAIVYAVSAVTSVGEFARAEAAQANDRSTKTWLTTSGNPRGTHAALEGETVAASETFSNGAFFPGDPSLPDEERANCQCIADWGDA